MHLFVCYGVQEPYLRCVQHQATVPYPVTRNPYPVTSI